MINIQKRIIELGNKDNAAFQSKLAPGIKKEMCLGTYVPDLRKLASEIAKEDDYKSFLDDLPHKYYDENILHSILISKIKDYRECVTYLNKFLPYVDNWAVCDTLSPKCFKKNRIELLKEIKKWLKSKDTYTIRLGIDMLMTHYLDEDFKEEYLLWVSKIESKEYYVKMMMAWFFQTALAKKWDESISYLEQNKLDTWVHNKTIQKAIESYRISDKQKDYLRTLKIKEK